MQLIVRRRSGWLAAVVVAVATLSAGCLVPPPGPAPLRYRDAVFGQVTTTSNVAYANVTTRQGDPVTLLADIYRPTGDTATARPAVVWVHGGSFAFGSKTSPEIVDEATTFARKGYVSVSINYRLSPTGCTMIDAECVLAIGDAQADAQTAVRWLRLNAATYGVDANRIAIAGTSAGAITALNVGYSGDSPSPGPYPGTSSRVRAAVSLSGAAILAAPGPGDAPALLFHGTSDTVVPYSWAQDTADAATEVGLVAYLISWEGAGHVPYGEHRNEILDLTTNFLYWMLDLAHAAP